MTLNQPGCIHTPLLSSSPLHFLQLVIFRVDHILMYVPPFGPGVRLKKQDSRHAHTYMRCVPVEAPTHCTAAE